jgi:hypothetical protein
MTDEPGYCDLCGTRCPRRRVAVELILEDGSTTGDVQLWGVVCAAEARSGRRDSAIARQLRAEAEEAGAYAGPARSRRRPAMPHARRQTRREAIAAAAALAAEARIVWFRTASAVPAEVAAAEAGGRPCTPGGRYYTHDGGRLVDSTDELMADDKRRRWLAAEARFINAGHPPITGRRYAHPDGRRAIVNSTSPTDLARFERHGFRPAAAPCPAATA